jgi:hypothetical protein
MKCLIMIFVLFSMNLLAQDNPCLETASNSLESCKSEVESERLLAIAKCLNTADPTTCNDEAQTAADNGLILCLEQDAAQKLLCERLGPAPYGPQIDPVNFGTTINNPYFPLIPNTKYIYEGQTEEGLVQAEVSVSTNTKEIMGVTCVEVREVASLDREVVADNLLWFAQDTEGNVWYFGESSKQIESGNVVVVEGSFTAGEDGAKPGIIMKAQPKVGDVYRQEFDLSNAEDVGAVLAIDESIEGPTGQYTNVLKISEASPLEPTSVKNIFYASGVGIIQVTDFIGGTKIDLIEIVKP